MVGPTAQLVALACYFNGHARGMAVAPFFPANSTCQSCESIHFLRQQTLLLGQSPVWNVLEKTPDEWFAREARPGRNARIVCQRVDDPRFPERLTAEFASAGGRWLLALRARGRSDLWEASWEFGNQRAADRRIWQVQYGLVAENLKQEMPKLRTVEALFPELRRTLGDILAFAEEQQLDEFAGCFRKAIKCLSATDPFAEVYLKDLAPAGFLILPERQLLAACQAAWVFGGMGSWNDTGFDGKEQVRYERLSASLFALLNEGICVSTNSAAVRGR
jgi:hypothetical protein